MKKPVQRYFKAVRGVAGAVKAIWRTTRRHNTAFVPALTTSFKLYLAENFSLKEIVGYGLYLPQVKHEMPVMISKHNSLEKLTRLNPREFEERVENKDLFYKNCRSAGLPVPEHYGLFRRGTGVDANDQPIADRDDWLAYFRSTLPAHFIIKDVKGVYGSGFHAFERQADGFMETNGQLMPAEEFYDFLFAHSTGGLVMQERLFNHPDMTLGEGNDALCTLRLTTLVQSEGDIALLFYIMKIPVGKNITDNFSMGTSGNLIAFGDRDSGTLRGARVLHPSVGGLSTVRTHPSNNHPLDGYVIPQWHDAVALAKRAHRAFSEFGTLGWDMALTARGPVILETNPWWDPPMYAPNVMSRENWLRIFG